MAEYDKNSSNLTEFPTGIPPETETLNLYANKIKKVPPAIGTLTNLTVLNCFNNVIGLSLPEDVNKLTELEEVNFAANKLAMLKDAHFTGWSKVKVLNLNDNNLSSIGSLAPLVALTELRIFANQLSALPTLAASADDLTIYEAHKNRVDKIDDGYFTSTPALERLSLWANALTSLPSSLTKCAKLVGVQVHENKQLASLPEGPWPKSLETLFVQDTKICSLPASLTGCALKRVNVSHLELDSDGDALAKKMGEMVLGTKDGIFWAKDGAMQRSKAL